MLCCNRAKGEMIMATELYPVAPHMVTRKWFNSVQELAKTIADSVKTKRAMTLATDYRWYADAVITPFFAHVTNVSICYDGNFIEKELLDVLLAEGVYPNQWLGQSSFFMVWREKEDNVCVSGCWL